MGHNAGPLPIRRISKFRRVKGFGLGFILRDPHLSPFEDPVVAGPGHALRPSDAPTEKNKGQVASWPPRPPVPFVPMRCADAVNAYIVDWLLFLEGETKTCANWHPPHRRMHTCGARGR